MLRKCDICGKEFDAEKGHFIHCPECYQWILFGCTNSPRPPKKLSDGMKKLLADSRSADALGVSYGQYMGMRAGRVPAKRRRRK